VKLRIEMAKQIRGNRNAQIISRKNGGNRPKTNSQFRTIKSRPTKSKARIQDARQKIIQKKRKVVTDARDVLTNKAKPLDARNKLDNIRNSIRNVRGAPVIRSPAVAPINSKVKVIGSNILQKIDRNGKISLVTNKSRSTSRTSGPTDINFAIKKQLGLIAPSRPHMKRPPPRKPHIPRNPQIPRNPVPIRKTIVNDLDYGVHAEPVIRDYGPALYKWVKPDLRPASHLIGSLEPTRQAMRDVMREELLLAGSSWNNLVTPKTRRLQPSSYVDLDAMDEDDDMPIITGISKNESRISLQGSVRSSNVHSRLDSLSNQPRSHGILAQTKTKVVVPAGHRIVVSNLQPSVTEDDIKELFEDIGQLLSAKLVRPGVAEVIYKNLKDAQKAVDTYHNRQLDGQPMKCLLVNKRPLHHPTAAPLPKSEVILGRKSGSSLNPENRLVPDISTIHKVLFQRK